MKFLEKDLEDLIWGAIQDNRLHDLKERDFPTYNEGVFFRQYDFGEGFGIADLIQVEAVPYKMMGIRCFDARITIYELKKDKIDYSTLDQALKYVRACQRIIDIIDGEGKYSMHRQEIRICLIGRTIEKNSSFCYLSNVLKNVSLYTYHYDVFDGLTFKLESDYLPTSNKTPKIKIPPKTALNMMRHTFMNGIDERRYKRNKKGKFKNVIEKV